MWKYGITNYDGEGNLWISDNSYPNSESAKAEAEKELAEATGETVGPWMEETLTGIATARAEYDEASGITSEALVFRIA